MQGEVGKWMGLQASHQTGAEQPKCVTTPWAAKQTIHACCLACAHLPAGLQQRRPRCAVDCSINAAAAQHSAGRGASKGGRKVATGRCTQQLLACRRLKRIEAQLVPNWATRAAAL